MQSPRAYARSTRQAWRIALSHYVGNGISAALGLLLISAGVHLLFGPYAAAAASIGVVVCIPPDQPAPRRGKFWQLVPAAVVGLPLFYLVQLVHAKPFVLGILIVVATFAAFLGAAWGKRGLPISISAMFAMIFSLAADPQHTNNTPFTESLYFGLGAAAYLLYGTAANAMLNKRYRVQIMADTLLSLTQAMRALAQQFSGQAQPGDATQPVGLMLSLHAALTEQLQSARNVLLESPRTAARQRLAGMLMMTLDLRDHLLACELDVDELKTHAGHQGALDTLSEVLRCIANNIDAMADSLLLGQAIEPYHNSSIDLSNLRPHTVQHLSAPDAPARHVPLLRSLSRRVATMQDEAQRLFGIARGDIAPDLAVVRTAWQMFVSPTTWSIAPFIAIWRLDAPPMRHAIRAACAVGFAYVLSLLMPWGSHEYWILLTIVVVLRGSFAQTLERRNSRVAGTLVGCIAAGLLLATHPGPLTLLIVLTVSQAIAHAFAIRRYMVTAVSATILGLVQAYTLHHGTSPVFEVIERIADTLLGVGIAWGFSYLLPSWERTQIPALIKRTLQAQAHHAKVALGLGQLQAVDNEPELEWRLARREAYDSLSALVQATQRSVLEPAAVRPAQDPLRHLLAHSYQLLAQLTTVKTMLLLRRGRLRAERIREPLAITSGHIHTALTQLSAPPTALEPLQEQDSLTLPDPFIHDLSPWLLRRLELAHDLSLRVQKDAVDALNLAPSPTNHS